MTKAHRMHLKGPWEYRLLEGGGALGDLAVEGRIKLPAAWQTSFGEFRGTVRYERFFNCPPNLDPEEEVYVIFTGIGGAARLFLNEVELGAVDEGTVDFEFEIKSLLQPRNLLVAELRFEGGNERPGGLWGPVALEIRGPDSED